jgi:hypothetical protein
MYRCIYSDPGSCFTNSILALVCSHEVVLPRMWFEDVCPDASFLLCHGDDGAARTKLVDIEHQAHPEDIQSAHRTLRPASITVH